jgi:hypothetical protein
MPVRILRRASASRSSCSSVCCSFQWFCPANAASLHWQLNGVTFSDGGRAFGGFDYDAYAGVYSNINITTPESVLSGSYYNSAAPYANSTSSSFFNGVSTVPVAFDNTGGLTTGVALANISDEPAFVPMLIRDDTGTRVLSTTISLPANGRTSFLLPDKYKVDWEARNGGVRYAFGRPNQCSGPPRQERRHAYHDTSSR